MSGLDALIGDREITSPADMHALGEQMGRMLHPGDLVVLTGVLGAGKTTLTRGIGEGLGVRGPIQSPTFVLARTHPSLVGGAPLVPGYTLKLNSYDLSVDIELYDAIQRLKFEHPEVGCVVLTSDRTRVFCAGANISMLGQSSHAHKVNFCKFTNETRNGI